MRVIGVDPSLRKSGIVNLELVEPRNGNQAMCINVLDCAVVETEVGTDVLDVIAAVHEQVLEFLDEEQVPVYIEVPVFGRNPGVLIQQGFLIGGVSALLDLEGTRPVNVNPMSVKALLDIPKTPKGQRTDKGLVVQAIRECIGDPEFLADDTQVNREAVCDAIGIALAGTSLED